MHQALPLGFLWGLLVASATGIGCNRSEPEATPVQKSIQEKGPPIASREPAPTTDERETKPARAQPRCTIALHDEPPPVAQPADDCPTPTDEGHALPTGSLRFPDAPGAPRLMVERAETTQARARGLMFRTAMDENAGMLFSWPDLRVRSFWMKNTCLPLDMLFVDEQDYIAGVLEQVPPMNTLSRSIPCPAARVLEVNAGYVRRHGIMPGQRIEVDFE